jgi:small subunit ribosomal protein S20
MHKTHLRKTLRRFREALAAGNKEAAQRVFTKTVSAIDKAIRKGVIHRNTAARYKSRLSARLRALK